MIPIFQTHYSIGRGTLTCNSPNKNGLDISKPISVFDICKKYGLSELILAENSMAGFIEAYKNSNKLDIQLKFGIRFNITSCATDLSQESLNKQSKIIIFMRNSAGYRDLIKLYSKCHSDKDRFFYSGRLEWDDLKDLNTDNLLIVIPFYDSFIFKNLLESGQCLPNFHHIKPIFLKTNCGLPFDDLISESIEKFCLLDKLETLIYSPIYYYSKKNFKSYMTFRCINGRSQFEKPELSHMHSDEFCWESYCNKVGIKFLD